MRSAVVLLAFLGFGIVFVGVPGSGSDGTTGDQVSAAAGPPQAPMAGAEAPDLAQAAAMMGRQPVSFIENQGQWEGDFSYVANFGPMAVFLEDRGWAFTLTEYKEKARDPSEPLADRGVPGSEPARGVAVRMRFGNGADAATPIPEQRLSGVHNYFLGDDPDRWRSNVPLHGSVRMEHLYPGIDVRTRGKDGHFEYDLLVEPGADLARVEVEVEGADGLRLDADGTLVMDTVLGPVRQPVPETWQVLADGERQTVLCRYVLLDDTRFGFAAPEWNRDHALVVDPGLVWSTFLGGIGWEEPYGMALDPSGEVTVAGFTGSFAFPTTPGTYATTYNGGTGDAFVTRLDATGSNLLWSTFLGGSDFDVAEALAFDSSGAVTVAGWTSSSDFPTTPGAYGTTYNGGSEAFVARLDATGSNLLWSTFLGGSGNDRAEAVALDPSGEVTVAGGTASSDFPVTIGAYDTTLNGFSDGFVTRLDATGSNLPWSTFLGGSRGEVLRSLALDPSGAVTVAGGTSSSDFPVTIGAYDTTLGGTGDAFVTRLNATASDLLWSTFLGGNDGDNLEAMALDPSGAVTVAGWTSSSDFPTTPGAYGTTYSGGSHEAFVTRLDATGSSLLWSTFLGGSSWDYAYALALDTSGAVTVAGNTGSSTFPTTPGTYDTTHNGGDDAFVTRLDTTGSSLLWSTFLGGSGNDYAEAVALDPSGAGAVTVAGWTFSSTFPITPMAYQNAYSSGDVFVTRLLIAPGPPPCATGACLDVTGIAAIGGSLGLSLQSPTSGGVCYVFASPNQIPAGYAVTLGGTTHTIYVDLGAPGVIPFADPSNTFGQSLTNPVTDANGGWCYAFPIPNDPTLVGQTFYGEALVTDMSGSWVSNVVTVTIQ